ncbi:MAG: helix-turn-helix domain-containing protein [Candidatus Obscuribacterales bacterium]|nr:helix-turn-helix domain-containing protein [Candidatus Obscuribacterales bacterium]
MGSVRIPLQPTLRQILESEALSESRLIFGEDFLDREVSQVVGSLYGGQKDGTLAVVRVENLVGQQAFEVQNLAGLVLIEPPGSALATTGKSSAAKTQVGLNLDLEHVVKLCTEASTPLLILQGFGEPQEVAAEIRASYLSEVKKASTRLHTHLIRVLIEEGLSGLVDRLAEMVERPVAVESADFKILAAQNMSSTPLNQQRTLTEEVAEELQRELREPSDPSVPELLVEPVRIGRRLVAPIVLEGAVVGYISILVRPTDNDALLTEYLRPAAVAAMVDFSQRRRDFSATYMTHASLLKDLLSGETLATSDQEQLERYFGFDIRDGFLVFAVKITPDEAAKAWASTDEYQALVEMEGANVAVVPFDAGEKKTWHDLAEELKASVTKVSAEAKVQIGAGRLARTILDLYDSYGEARQALITGSMMHGESEFLISYSDLGIKRILYLMSDHPELERFYEEHLAPLEAYDVEWETDLVPTLRVYLEHGANLNSAAKALFIHRHTMRYRLEQIADILKVDIDSQEVLLNLQFSFQIKDMKGIDKS